MLPNHNALIREQVGPTYTKMDASGPCRIRSALLTLAILEDWHVLKGQFYTVWLQLPQNLSVRALAHAGSKRKSAGPILHYHLRGNGPHRPDSGFRSFE